MIFLGARVAENSKIEWTDHTFNPWIGCQRVSPGCQHCYAETMNNYRGWVKWGPQGTRRRASDAKWKEPLKWNRQAEKEARRFRVFCASLADVFEDRPELIPWRAELCDLIEATPYLDWQLLTKRPEDVIRLVPPSWRAAFPPNVWIGTSIESQKYADERMPHLMKIPARVRFLSVEPLLGPVALGLIGMTPSDISRRYAPVAEFIHWVIVGGESGPGARPFDLSWAHDIILECTEANVAVFVKQLGAVPTEQHLGGGLVQLRDRKGGNIEEWPEALRIREMPV